MRPVRAYTTEYGEPAVRDTMMVWEETRVALVTYHGDGASYRVRVVQRPNPIGFHARLPGDDDARRPR